MPHEADLKAAIMKFPLADRAYMVKEMLAYIGQFRGYQLGGADPVRRGAAPVPRPLLIPLTTRAFRGAGLQALPVGRRGERGELRR